jgi:hypothetical protein
MKQPIANVTDEDINRILNRDFPTIEFSIIETLLQSYTSESKSGANRVYAAVLKLSNGDFNLLKSYIEQAKIDYRDVIALSEYPNYSKYAFNNNLTKSEEQQLINDDWIQYQSWLKRI